MQRPFLPLLCALRENKTVRGIGAKADNIYTVEAGFVTYDIRASPVTSCGLEDTTLQSEP